MSQAHGSVSRRALRFAGAIRRVWERKRGFGARYRSPALDALWACLLAMPVTAVCGPERSEEAQAPGAGDGGLDLSRWLLDGRGVLPVPIFITDPALGAGGGLAIVRFRRPDGSEAKRGAVPDAAGAAQPNVLGFGVFRTSNGSKGVGAGALLRFRNGDVRYRGIASDLSMNLEYHLSADRQASSREISYSVDGLVLSQGVQFRTGSEHLYVGPKLIYMDLDVAFDGAAERALFRDEQLSRRNVGLGASVEYDSRDNVFTPSRGWLAALEGVHYDDRLGSDSDFKLYLAKAYGYLPVGRRWVLGGRVDLRLAQGDAPIYRLPYIELRGIGAARYQDTRTLVLESEARLNLSDRWALVGFAGAGRAWGRRANFGAAPSRASKGLGLRYLVSDELGLYVGVDYAWGPEDGAAYVQVGGAWR